MQLHTGTSGWDYDEWSGSFYPAELPKPERLRYYAERLGAVEVNNTFYRMPKRDVVRRWASQVPAGFSFVLKASRRITHQARLKDAGDSLGYLWRSAAELGEHLGPILFQLPPYLRKDLDRLRAFLAELPEGLRAVVEFRHGSWHDEEVNALLREAGAAVCVAEHDGDPGAAPPLVATADWGYVRLRRCDYGAAELAAWADRLAALPWREVFVFFKHEEGGAGAACALALREAWGAAGGAAPGRPPEGPGRP